MVCSGSFFRAETRNESGEQTLGVLLRIRLSYFFMPDNFLLFRKSYDLVLWLYPILDRMPKAHRPVLGAEIERTVISLVISVIRANKSSGPERESLQRRISRDLDVVRILMRLMKDLRFMSVKQYAAGADRANEIGRMLSSWMRSNRS